jgi:hypothetical protein
MACALSACNGALDAVTIMNTGETRDFRLCSSGFVIFRSNSAGKKRVCRKLRFAFGIRIHSTLCAVCAANKQVGSVVWTVAQMR